MGTAQNKVMRCGVLVNDPTIDPTIDPINDPINDPTIDSINDSTHI